MPEKITFSEIKVQSYVFYKFTFDSYSETPCRQISVYSLIRTSGKDDSHSQACLSPGTPKHQTPPPTPDKL